MRNKHLKERMPELLLYDESLRDNKLLAYVKYLGMYHQLDIVQQYAILEVLRKVNPESFFREWRCTQEHNPQLRGKDWDKRQRKEAEVRHDYDGTFQEKIEEHLPRFER